MATLASHIPTHLPASPSDGIRTLARLGFAAKGMVYTVLGVLAVMAATGTDGGRTADKTQVLQTIQDMPMGRWLLGLVALGLAGYVLWRFVQAIRDTEGHGNSAKGMGKRIAYAASALGYGVLAYIAGKAALENSTAGSGSGGNSRQSFVATLLEQSYGQWLVGAIGLTVIGIGLYQLFRAYSGSFAKHVNSSQIPAGQQRLVHRMGQLGYTARGIVWAILGYFLIQAAMHSNANEAQGTEGAFDFLASMGSGLLLVVALGLVAYGLYMFVRAKYPILRGV
ncbi:DUF1206 domain-containing protein [Hymenobacter latericus]|uniref:DUF1206 domain-containing protein n=1 Tax=Hymenobacter sp. YIM 151858-1 TaxID=2987688 RepID=UPI0022265FEB|nr:DUF1206 domain-containing protein [Hymenobacter sp. YIM 151858-1]UYZ58009.1 DUF1206 domain-containing protein [Hymenobacter sp. YIM 151858-1]